MFEAELEMERRSSFLPLLLMACLVAAIAGMVAYVVIQVRARIAPQRAGGKWYSGIGSRGTRCCRDSLSHRPDKTQCL